MKMLKNSGNVALRDVGSRHSGGGLGLGSVILEVFSNLNGSMLLQKQFLKCIHSTIAIPKSHETRMMALLLEPHTEE